MSNEHQNQCAWIRERIEPWLDGDLDREDARAVETHTADCPGCAAELELARTVAATLRSLPLHQCPPEVVARAVAEAERERVSLRERLHGWFGPRLEVLLRPAMVAMIIVVAAAGVFVLSNRDLLAPAPEGYTQAEVEEAANEAMIAFAYVSKYSRRTATVLSDDVLSERVAPKVAEAVAESQRRVVEDALVPAVEEAVLNALFVETRPRIIESNK